jgi:hypothetical protein
LLWIRGEFLNSRADFGKIVVHGHTPVAEPEILPNRINIDTGAFATGRLTCIVLENGTHAQGARAATGLRPPALRPAAGSSADGRFAAVGPNQRRVIPVRRKRAETEGLPTRRPKARPVVVVDTAWRAERRPHPGDRRRHEEKCRASSARHTLGIQPRRKRRGPSRGRPKNTGSGALAN